MSHCRQSLCGLDANKRPCFPDTTTRTGLQFVVLPTDLSPVSGVCTLAAPERQRQLDVAAPLTAVQHCTKY